MPALDASFAVFALACFVAASSGSLFRAGSWYERLRKPSWRPPGWLFGPVWLVLYIMIALSGWLVWRSAPQCGAERCSAVHCKIGWGRMGSGCIWSGLVRLCGVAWFGVMLSVWRSEIMLQCAAWIV